MINYEVMWRNKLRHFLKENKQWEESNKTLVFHDKTIKRTVIYGDKFDIVWDVNKQTQEIERCSLIHDQKNTKKD